MALKFRRSVNSRSDGCGMLVTPVSVDSCGPFITTAAFTFVSGPSFRQLCPRPAGLVLPDYPAFVPVRCVALSFRCRSERGGAKGIRPRPANWRTHERNGFLKWSVSLRPVPGLAGGPQSAKGLPPPVKFDPDRDVNYASYANCGDDAFRAATETLASRAKTLGPLAAELQDWVLGQDAVFSIAKREKAMPAPRNERRQHAAPVRSRLIQIAPRTSLGDFDEAAGAFRKIAADSKSPWRPTARLSWSPACTSVRPRSRIRASRRPSTMPKSSSAEFWPTPALAAVQAPQEGCSTFVRCRVDPAGRLVELGHSDRETRRPATLPQDLGITDPVRQAPRAPTKCSRSPLRTSLPIGCGITAIPRMRSRAGEPRNRCLAARALPHAERRSGSSGA